MFRGFVKELLVLDGSIEPYSRQHLYYGSPVKTEADAKYSWLALYLVRGLGNQALKRLVAKFGTPGDVFRAGIKEAMAAGGIKEKVARRIHRREFICDPDEELKKAEKIRARIVTYAEDSYPRLLREIASPPMVLYIKGKDVPQGQVLLSMVGSRNASHYGIKTAEWLSEALARRDIGVVSGMAAGIDSASHRGCLRGGGYTAAVIGTGMDVVYPVSNRGLMEEIVQCGSVISEFPMGSPPEPRNFPIRNRIISGLTRGVVVVEATRRSGSLITASQALEQGREVFAVPGSISSFKSTGTHFLIKKGAALVENADDIFRELRLAGGKNREKGPYGDEEWPSPPDGMDESEEYLYEIMSDYPIHIDEIARKGRMDPARVSSLLMGMELKGFIKQLPGKMFTR